MWPYLTWVNSHRSLQDASKFSCSSCPTKMDGDIITILHHSSVDEVSIAEDGKYRKRSLYNGNLVLASSCNHQMIITFFKNTAAVGPIGACNERVKKSIWCDGTEWQYRLCCPNIQVLCVLHTCPVLSIKWKGYNDITLLVKSNMDYLITLLAEGHLIQWI